MNISPNDESMMDLGGNDFPLANKGGNHETTISVKVRNNGPS